MRLAIFLIALPLLGDTISPPTLTTFCDGETYSATCMTGERVYFIWESSFGFVAQTFMTNSIIHHLLLDMEPSIFDPPPSDPPAETPIYPPIDTPPLPLVVATPEPSSMWPLAAIAGSLAFRRRNVL